MNQKQILCFCPVVGDTKDAKRIKILQKAGFKVTVVAFERDYFVSRLPDCEIITLGKIRNGEYMSRVLIMLKSLIKLRKIVRKFDIVYALSPDLAIMAYIASLGKKNILILDLADIRRVQVSSSPLGKFTRIADRFLASHCDLIVVTSKGFITEYFRKTLKKDIKNYFLLENKVDYNIPIEYPEIGTRSEKIRIGYFGVLRDNWTIEFLLKLLSKNPEKYEIFAAGIDMLPDKDLKEIDKNVFGFHYLGPFQSPGDLNNLYKKVDIIAVFYPEHPVSRNWFNASKICRSNRFYEACYFEKPMLAFSFSEDGKEVFNLDIGHTYTTYNISECVTLTNKDLNYSNLARWTKNLSLLPKDIYTFQNEHLKLGEELKTIIKNKI